MQWTAMDAVAAGGTSQWNAVNVQDSGTILCAVSGAGYTMWASFPTSTVGTIPFIFSISFFSPSDSWRIRKKNRPPSFDRFSPDTALSLSHVSLSLALSLAHSPPSDTRAHIRAPPLGTLALRA